MATYAVTDTQLSAIADAIRLKTDNPAQMSVDDMPLQIGLIESGGAENVFPFSGTNPVFIDRHEEIWNLSDTSFIVGQSTSTGQTTIKSAISNRYTNTSGSPTVEFGDKDIVVVQRCLSVPVYADGYTDVMRQLQHMYTHITLFSKALASQGLERTAHVISSQRIENYDGTGKKVRSSNGYGLYMNANVPSVASATISSTYVRAASPNIYYRIGSNVMSADNIKKVIDCSFRWVLEVYAVDAYTSIAATINKTFDDAFTDGI